MVRVGRALFGATTRLTSAAGSSGSRGYSGTTEGVHSLHATVWLRYGVARWSTWASRTTTSTRTTSTGIHARRGPRTPGDDPYAGDAAPAGDRRGGARLRRGRRAGGFPETRDVRPVRDSPSRLRRREHLRRARRCGRSHATSRRRGSPSRSPAVVRAVSRPPPRRCTSSSPTGFNDAQEVGDRLKDEPARDPQPPGRAPRAPAPAHRLLERPRVRGRRLDVAGRRPGLPAHAHERRGLRGGEGAAPGPRPLPTRLTTAARGRVLCAIITVFIVVLFVRAVLSWFPRRARHRSSRRSTTC